MIKVYICHAFSADPKRNARRVAGICAAIASESVLPIAPQIYLPEFISESTDRALAMTLCIALLSVCDEIWVYGDITTGMEVEIEYAKQHNIKRLNCSKPRYQRLSNECS